MLDDKGSWQVSLVQATREFSPRSSAPRSYYRGSLVQDDAGAGAQAAVCSHALAIEFAEQIGDDDKASFSSTKRSTHPREVPDESGRADWRRGRSKVSFVYLQSLKRNAVEFRRSETIVLALRKAHLPYYGEASLINPSKYESW